uniref:Uncharacterized protein n=1 Tax=Daphnia galeata TaxID=27404 RepID=A0A8J2WCU6_9CRUS|nr:unnamed protein product [Daphnia galeata]
MFLRFIVALFLLSAVCGVMSASVATLNDDTEVADEKFEKDAGLDESSKSENKTNVDINVRDVTAKLTALKTKVTEAVTAANSTNNVTSAKSTQKENDEKATLKVDCKITTCSVRNGITICKTSANCTSANLQTNTTTETVTTPKAPVLDDDALKKKQDD